ncbi:O-antigen ligase family protein [Saltatorellus ferox]
MAVAVLAAGLALFMAGTRSVAYALFYLSFLPFLTLDPSQGGLVSIDGLEGGNVAWKLGVRAIATLGIAVLGYRRRGEVFALLARPASLPVLGLFAWAVIGLPRAQDPWVSFFRLGELLAFFVTGVVLATEVGARHDREPGRGGIAPGDVVRRHALALLPVLISAIAFSVLHPEIAFHESTSGVRRMGHKFMNSNVLGFSSTVVFLWAVSALRARWALHLGADPATNSRRERLREVTVALVALGLASYVLYHSRSRTASITALGGLAILFLPWRAPRSSGETATMSPGVSADMARLASLRRIGAVIAACLVLAVFATSIGTIEEWFMRGGTSADIASGTGRTGLWHDLLLVQVPKAPLVGAGYLNLSSAGGFEHAGHAWNNAHNTYLFALVSTGLPGFLCVLSIVAWPLLVAFQRAFRPLPGSSPAERLRSALDQEAWTLLFALQVIVAISGITGFGVAGYPNVAMLFHYGLFAWVLSPASTAHASEAIGASTDATCSARQSAVPFAAPPAATATRLRSAVPRLTRAVRGPQIPRSVR